MTEEELTSFPDYPAYNNQLNSNDQVTTEEAIAGLIFNHDPTDSHAAIDEETAGEMGRKILQLVLSKFRPDLFVDHTPHPSKVLQEVSIMDPDTGNIVTLEVRKDLETGALVGLDGSYLENTDEPVYDPYNFGHQINVEDQ